jgi:mycothiol system anti-sigma-R factor
MSCGNHHDMPCAEVLTVMYLYLDNEELPCAREIVTAHLGECSPCETQFGSEFLLKTLINRALCAEQAPPEVHSHIIMTITQIHLEITTVHEHP